MKDQVMKDEQLDLFLDEVQGETRGNVDPVSSNKAASNASEWESQTSSPFFQSIYFDGDGPEIVRKLRLSTDSLMRLGYVDDPDLRSFINALDEFERRSPQIGGETQKFHYDVNEGRYQGAHEENEHKILFLGVASGSDEFQALPGLVAVALSRISDNSVFMQAIKRCERFRWGIDFESGYQDNLSDDDLQRFFSLVSGGPSLYSTHNRLATELAELEPNSGNYRGFVSAFVDLTSVHTRPRYSPLSDREFEITPIQIESAALAIQGFETAISNDPEIEEPLEFLSCTYESELSGITGDSEFDEEQERWEEDFAIKTVASLEFQTETVTTMSNRLINFVSRECLGESQTELSKAIIRATGHQESSLNQKILAESALHIGIALGLTAELLFDTEIGVGKRILPDGRVNRHVRYPESLFTPPVSDVDLYEDVTDRFTLDLTPRLGGIVQGLCLLGVENKSFGSLLGGNQAAFKEALISVLEDIADRYCMESIPVNSIGHQMMDWLRAIGFSTAETYWLVGAAYHRPPTKVHYQNQNIEALSTRYVDSVTDYFDGRNI